MSKEKEIGTALMLDFAKAANGLIPVVAQDATSKDVLILAFANEEALKETRSSGYATFYSRSRQELWKKGLTSGDMLKVEDILINCEQNSLIYLVTPMGSGACHVKREDGRAHTSCYYRRLDENETLEFIEK